MSEQRSPYQNMMTMNIVIAVLLFLFPLLPLANGWDPTVVGLMLLPAILWLAIVLRMRREYRKGRKQ